MCNRIFFNLIIYKHFNVCCFIVVAYTTLDNLRLGSEIKLIIYICADIRFFFAYATT